MILMENFREHHKTLIKIDERVFSHSYVAPEIFTLEWLMENRHIKTSKKMPFKEESPFLEDREEPHP
jgi:hypothetical protein